MTFVDEWRRDRLRGIGIPEQTIALLGDPITPAERQVIDSRTDPYLHARYVGGALPPSPTVDVTVANLGQLVATDPTVKAAYVSRSQGRAFRTWDAMLADPAVAAPGLYVRGHSVVDGTGASTTRTRFAAQLAAKVAGARPGIVTTIEGNGGWTTAQMLAAAPGQLGTRPAGSVGATVLMCLLNDYHLGVAPATSQANMTALIAALRADDSAAPDMTVVIAVEWLRGDTTNPAHPWVSYVAAAHAVAEVDPDVAVVDLGARMGPGDPDPADLFTADKAHPDDTGHALIAFLLAADLMRGAPAAPVPAGAAIVAGIPPVANSGWAGRTRDTDGALLRFSDAAAGNSITYQFAGDAGTYSIALDHRQQANAGQYDVYLDGVKQGAGGTFQGYAATNTIAFHQVDGFYLPTSGLHTIQLVMATKHASSSAYAGVIRAVYLNRTGA